jgi:hypothetical protein
MSIAITCPGCHARFNVSDKYAGQTGPCPKCKHPIRIPEKSEEVVIHAPDDFGPKDAKGRAVLKPIERDEPGVSPVTMAAVAATCIACLVVAFFLGRTYDSGQGSGVPLPLLATGAVVLGPLLAFAGYGLLRDHELEPHRGASLWIRAVVCGLIYAALWGAYAFIKHQLLDGEIEVFHLMFLAPVLAVIGGVTALASLELSMGSGVLHFGIYVLITCLLRWVMKMPVY